MLVTKVLQAIASQVEFEGEKEEYMIPTNDFVIDNIPQMLAFFHALSVQCFRIFLTIEQSPQAMDSKKEIKN